MKDSADGDAENKLRRDEARAEAAYDRAFTEAMKVNKRCITDTFANRSVRMARKNFDLLARFRDRAPKHVCVLSRFVNFALETLETFIDASVTWLQCGPTSDMSGSAELIRKAGKRLRVVPTGLAGGLEAFATYDYDLIICSEGDLQPQATALQLCGLVDLLEGASPGTPCIVSASFPVSLDTTSQLTAAWDIVLRRGGDSVEFEDADSWVLGDMDFMVRPLYTYCVFEVTGRGYGGDATRVRAACMRVRPSAGLWRGGRSLDVIREAHVRHMHKHTSNMKYIVGSCPSRLPKREWLERPFVDERPILCVNLLSSVDRMQGSTAYTFSDDILVFKTEKLPLLRPSCVRLDMLVIEVTLAFLSRCRREGVPVDGPRTAVVTMTPDGGVPDVLKDLNPSVKLWVHIRAAGEHWRKALASVLRQTAGAAVVLFVSVAPGKDARRTMLRQARLGMGMKADAMSLWFRMPRMDAEQGRYDNWMIGAADFGSTATVTKPVSRTLSSWSGGSGGSAAPASKPGGDVLYLDGAVSHVAYTSYHDGASVLFAKPRADGRYGLRPYDPIAHEIAERKYYVHYRPRADLHLYPSSGVAVSAFPLPPGFDRSVQSLAFIDAVRTHLNGGTRATAPFDDALEVRTLRTVRRIDEALGGVALDCVFETWDASVYRGAGARTVEAWRAVWRHRASDHATVLSAQLREVGDAVYGKSACRRMLRELRPYILRATGVGTRAK